MQATMSKADARRLKKLNTTELKTGNTVKAKKRIKKGASIK